LFFLFGLGGVVRSEFQGKFAHHPVHFESVIWWTKNTQKKTSGKPIHVFLNRIFRVGF
jgi:hypothetical protein